MGDVVSMADCAAAPPKAMRRPNSRWIGSSAGRDEIPFAAIGLLRHAAFDFAHLHHRRRAGARLRLWPRGPAAAPSTSDRLSARGHCGWAFYPRLGCRPVNRQPARRDWRHSSHVRRRFAFLARGPTVGPRHRHSGGADASAGRDAARHGACLVAGLDAGRRADLRHRAVGREHRGALAPAPGARRSAGASRSAG
jgi:hypothetical protein